MAPLQNIIVIGGSYVGVNTAQLLAKAFAGRFRVLMIEKNSHFQHLFAFPRFAVTDSVDTHKAFIPLDPGTFKDCPPASGSIVRAIVTSINGSQVQLDRRVNVGGQEYNALPFSYLVIATGTKLTPPSTLPGSEKIDGVAYLRKHVQYIRRSSNIVVIGGGAVGVQMSTDIKEIYPEKNVTLVHSRPTVMNRFDTKFSDLIKVRCNELGIKTEWGTRVKLPRGGYPTDGSTFDVDFVDGSSIPADFAIICTGQTPQTDLIKRAYPQTINDNGFIRVLKTLQVDHPELKNVFAVGDVADTGAHKAARPAVAQTEAIVKNIQHLIDQQPLEVYPTPGPAGIHMTLGVTKNVVFRNPEPGSNEPHIKWADNGTLDMNIDGVWTRRGGGVNAYL